MVDSGFTFNGRHSSEFFIVNSKQRPILPQVDQNVIEIPNMPGVHFSGKSINIREFSVNITLINENIPQLKRNVAEWLLTDGPQVLIFDDEPDKFYFAMISGATNLDEIFRFGAGTLTFFCPDPYAYEAIERSEILPATIDNQGTAETYPQIQVTVQTDLTQFQITNKSNLNESGTPKSIIIGQPATVTQEPFTPEELVFDDSCQSTSSWQTASEVDNGIVAGEMGAGPNGFYASKFGDYTIEQWQGPSLIRDIGTSIQDFRADIYFKQFNVGHETGMIEVYFRDANGNVVAKIGFEDPWEKIVRNQGKVQIGDMNTGYDMYAKSDWPEGWNNFDGIMRLERRGNVWTPYFAKIINGQHDWIKSTLRYVDGANQHMAPISKVQVAIRKWPATDETDMAVHRIKIYKLNTPTNQNTQVPYVAQAGDVFYIDCATGAVLKNGEPRLDLVDIKTDFFSLVKGLNTLELSPGITATISYRHKFL